jgi:hypothetical protein
LLAHDFLSHKEAHWKVMLRLDKDMTNGTSTSQRAYLESLERRTPLCTWCPDFPGIGLYQKINELAFEAADHLHDCVALVKISLQHNSIVIYRPKFPLP